MSGTKEFGSMWDDARTISYYDRKSAQVAPEARGSKPAKGEGALVFGQR